MLRTYSRATMLGDSTSLMRPCSVWQSGCVRGKINVLPPANPRWIQRDATAAHASETPQIICLAACARARVHDSRRASLMK